MGSEPAQHEARSQRNQDRHANHAGDPFRAERRLPAEHPPEQYDHERDLHDRRQRNGDQQPEYVTGAAPELELPPWKDGGIGAIAIASSPTPMGLEVQPRPIPTAAAGTTTYIARSARSSQYGGRNNRE